MMVIAGEETYYDYRNGYCCHGSCRDADLGGGDCDGGDDCKSNIMSIMDAMVMIITSQLQ